MTAHPKIWTRQALQRRQNASSARKATRHQDKQRTQDSALKRRTLLLLGAASLGTVAVLTALLAWSSHTRDPAVIAGSAVFTTLLVGFFWLYRYLSPKFGRLTTLALLCGSSALLFAGVAALLPICADVSATGFCPRVSVADWALVGALVPCVTFLLTAPPIFLYRAFGHTGRFLTRQWRAGR